MINGKQKWLTMPVIAWESPVLRIAINIVRHISGKWGDMAATFPKEKNRRQSGVTEKMLVNLNIFIKKTAKAVHIQVKLKKTKAEFLINGNQRYRTLVMTHKVLTFGVLFDKTVFLMVRVLLLNVIKKFSLCRSAAGLCAMVCSTLEICPKLLKSA